jgi:hypothetical protein
MLCRNGPPTNQIYIVTVVVIIASLIIYAHLQFENGNMQYNAATGITDYTPSARCYVVCRLAINQYAYCEEVGTLKFEGYSAY